jgi:hypothetical protein
LTCEETDRNSSKSDIFRPKRRSVTLNIPYFSATACLRGLIGVSLGQETPKKWTDPISIFLRRSNNIFWRIVHNQHLRFLIGKL